MEQAVSNAMRKARREGFVRHRAISMKPPQPDIDPTDTRPPRFFVRYIGPNGVEVRKQCTPELFTRCQGKRMKRTPHTGLDMKLNTHFIILQKKGGLAEQIDLYPHRAVLHGMRLEKEGDNPASLPLVVKVRPDTGELEVLQLPSIVSENTVLAMMDALDNVAEVSAGMVVAGMTVSSVSGDRIYFDVSDLEERAVSSGNPFDE